MYVVVRYPKTLKAARSFDFNIYAKQHSQKEKLIPYYEEQKARHFNCCVLLVDRKTAIAMHKVWHNYFINIGQTLTSKQSSKSFHGHHNPFKEEWEEE